MLLVIAKNWKITRALAIVYEPIEITVKPRCFIVQLINRSVLQSFNTIVFGYLMTIVFVPFVFDTKSFSSLKKYFFI